MIIFDHHIRVRYADTDQMSYVYYGKYAEYLEEARTEMIRSWGLPYREIENAGVLMPVAEFEMKFRKPARYDDLLKVRCIVSEPARTRMIVNNEVYNENEEMLALGKVTLAFVKKDSLRPCRAPENLRKIVEEYLEIE